MKFLSGAHKSDLVGYQTDEAGQNLGHIFGGTINHLPDVAANLCLQLHGRHPITPPWHQKLYEQYGKEIIVGLTLALATALIGLWVK